MEARTVLDHNQLACNSHCLTCSLEFAIISGFRSSSSLCSPLASLRHSFACLPPSPSKRRLRSLLSSLTAPTPGSNRELAVTENVLSFARLRCCPSPSLYAIRSRRISIPEKEIKRRSKGYRKGYQASRRKINRTQNRSGFY